MNIYDLLVETMQKKHIKIMTSMVKQMLPHIKMESLEENI